jgi:hypothetical protein
MMTDVTELKRPRLNLYSPAAYRVCVRGSLEASGAEQLSGLTISREDHAGNHGVTTLHSEFADQASLLRVLNHLLSLEVTLVSVEYLPAE